MVTPSPHLDTVCSLPSSCEAFMVFKVSDVKDCRCLIGHVCHCCIPLSIGYPNRRPVSAVLILLKHSTKQSRYCMHYCAVEKWHKRSWDNCTSFSTTLCWRDCGAGLLHSFLDGNLKFEVFHGSQVNFWWRFYILMVLLFHLVESQTALKGV